MPASTLLIELKRRGIFRVAGAYLVSAWAIAKMTELGLEKFDAPDWWMRAILLILMAGLPIVLVLTWTHDLATVSFDLDIGDGVDSASGKLVRPEDNEGGRNVDAGKWSGVAIALCCTALLAVASVAYWLFNQASPDAAIPATETRKSIAVLPFANLGGNPEDEFFSDGIAEELLNMLARIPELRVISRSSAFSYKGKGADAPTIARELGVSHILEGSVRRAGTRVRITAQLVDPATDTQLWANTYDRELDDVFAVQDDIGFAVTEQLKLVLLAQKTDNRALDPAAYTLFLQGRHLSRLGSTQDIEQGIKLLEQALSIAPDYSDAWSELGLNQIRRARLDEVSDAEAFEQARYSLQRAITVDPGNATAHSRLSWLAMSLGDLNTAAEQASIALTQEPGNVTVLINAAQLLTMLGRHDEARRVYERAILLDPTSASVRWNFSESLWAADEMEESLREAKLALSFGPNYLGVHYTLGVLYLYEGRYEDALEMFEAEGSEDLRSAGVAMALYSLEQTSAFETALQDAQAQWGEERPSEIAAIHLWSGDTDAAFSWLEQAWASGDRRLFLMIQNPLMEPAKLDPRWGDFLRKIGRSPDQLAVVTLDIPF